VFGLSSSKSRQRRIHQRSSAIGGQFSTIWKPGKDSATPKAFGVALQLER